MSRSFESDHILKLLSAPDLVEAADWLQRGGGYHYVGEMSADDSKQLVQNLYRLGALRVVAVEIGENAGLASTDHLIVTLPDAKQLRDAIFSWNNDRVRLLGIDPDGDYGQNYLLILFD